MTQIPLQLLPRLCPFCGERTIIGHGQRLKQAHDTQREQIWIRRGLCRPCKKTFTVLPDWSPPSGTYSFHCRQKAWELLRQSDSNWEAICSGRRRRVGKDDCFEGSEVEQAALPWLHDKGVSHARQDPGA